MFKNKKDAAAQQQPQDRIKDTPDATIAESDQIITGNEGRERSQSGFGIIKGNSEAIISNLEDGFEFGDITESERLRLTQAAEEKGKMKRNKIPFKSFISGVRGKGKLHKDEKGQDAVSEKRESSSSAVMRSSNKGVTSNSFTEANPPKLPPEGYQTDDSNKKSHGKNSESQKSALYDGFEEFEAVTTQNDTVTVKATKVQSDNDGSLKLPPSSKQDQNKTSERGASKTKSDDQKEKTDSKITDLKEKSGSDKKKKQERGGTSGATQDAIEQNQGKSRPSTTQKSKSEKAIDQSALGKIGYQKFYLETDPRNIQIKVKRYVKNIFTEGSYQIETSVRETKNRYGELLLKDHLTNPTEDDDVFPIYQIKRTYDDFWAFHEALRSKFKYVKFNELPKAPNQFAIFNKTTQEERIKQLQKLFEQILTDAFQHDVLRPKMLAMLYVFLIQEATIIQKDQRDDKKEDIVNTNNKQNLTTNASQEYMLDEKLDKNAQFDPLLARTIKSKGKKAKPYFNKKQINSIQQEVNQASKNMPKHMQDDDDGLFESVMKRRSSFDDGDRQLRSNLPSRDLINPLKRQSSVNRRAKSGMRSPQFAPNFGKVKITDPQSASRKMSDHFSPIERSPPKNSTERQFKKYLNSLEFIKQDFKEQFDRNMDRITLDSLGRVYVQLPQVQDFKGTDVDEDLNHNRRKTQKIIKKENQAGWEPFHAKFENHCQLQFLENIVEESFTINYLINRCITKLITMEIYDEKSKKRREIDVLQIFHKFDTKPIMITAPQIYEPNDALDGVLDEKLYSWDPELHQQYKEMLKYLRNCNIELLKQMQEMIRENSLNEQDIIGLANKNNNAMPSGGIALPIDGSNRYPVGKILLEIKDIQNFEWTSENLFIKISCHPYVLYTKKQSYLKREKIKVRKAPEYNNLNAILENQDGQDEVNKLNTHIPGLYQDKQIYTLKFRQRFYIPIHNHFETLSIEIVNQKNKGFFTEYQEKIRLAKFDIRIPDILELFDVKRFKNRDDMLENFTDQTLHDNKRGFLKLPLDEQIDYKRMGMKGHEPHQSLVKTEQANLQIRVTDMTTHRSILVANPNKGIVEDRKQKENYSFKDMNHVLARAKLVILYWEWFINIDTFIYQFHYPKFSYMAWVVILFLIANFDPHYLLSYLILIIVVLVATHSPYWYENYHEGMKDFFFKDRHPLMQNLNEIKKWDEVQFKRIQEQMFENEIQADGLKQLKDNYLIEERKGIINRYREAKRGTAHTLNVIDLYCDYFEKYKNLLKWEDPKMTMLFFFVALFALIIVTFLPLRLFMMLSFSYRFYKGRNWNNRRQRSNQELCKIELQKLFDDLKINVDQQIYKMDPEYDEHNTDEKISSKKIPFEHIDLPWEKVLQSTKNKSINFKNFERNYFIHFQRQLRIFIPKDLLSARCKTPMQLIEYFGRTRFVLKPVTIHNDDEWEKNTKVYKPVVPLYMRLPIFVRNRIPSDIYRIKNPKMIINKHKKTHYRYVKDSQINTMQNQADGDVSPSVIPTGENQQTQDGANDADIMFENITESDRGDSEEDCTITESKEAKLSSKQKKKQKKEHIIQGKMILKEQGTDAKAIKKMKKHKKELIGKGAVQVNRISMDKNTTQSQAVPTSADINYILTNDDDMMIDDDFDDTKNNQLLADLIRANCDNEMRTFGDDEDFQDFE